MDKVQVYIEHELNSTSTATVWKMLSTPQGMERWLADTVTLKDDVLTFTWGSPYDHHEMRQANIVVCKKNFCIRFVWTDESNLGTYVEIKMERMPLTGAYILRITDFIESDDRQWLLDTWGHNFRRLRRTSGL